MPLAVVGSNVVVEVNGKKVRGRQYPWGVAEGTSAEVLDKKGRLQRRLQPSVFCCTGPAESYGDSFQDCVQCRIVFACAGEPSRSARV